jgi:uncharacterized membrane protein
MSFPYLKRRRSDEFIPPIKDLDFFEDVISIGDGDAILMAHKLAASLLPHLVRRYTTLQRPAYCFGMHSQFLGDVFQIDTASF